MGEISNFVPASDFGAQVSGDLPSRTTDAYLAHLTLREGDITKPNMHYWISEPAPDLVNRDLVDDVEAPEDPASPDAILFLHAAFADHTCFNRQLTHFSPTHRVIVCGLPGHGASHGCDFLVDTADGLAAILDAEEISQVHVVGVDVGGILAQDFAERYPERVLSLFVVGAYDITDGFSAHRAEVVGRQNRALMLEVISPQMFVTGVTETAAVTPEGRKNLEAAALTFRKNSIGSYAGVENIGIGDDATEGATDSEVGSNPEATVPLFIGVGSQDSETAIEDSRAWAERVGAQFEIFEGAGRVANLDAPDAFNAALENFITS